MGIVGLIIQQHDGSILFQNVREYLTPDKAQQVAKAFRRQIVNYDESKQSISTNHLSGSIVVLNMYRIHYMILSEVFILAISQANDNPYEGTNYLARAKRVLQTVSKEITVVQISKKYTEIYFALERVLFGEDGVEVLQQRNIAEIQPHFISGTSLHTSNTVMSNIPNIMSSGIQVITTPVNVVGKLIDLGSGANNNSIFTPTLSNYDNQTSSQSFVGIGKLEGISIPSKIFTVDANLSKLDKHIYDPPPTVKWGTTSVPLVTNNSSRVGNRIMFTLRHPNANRDREGSAGSPPSFNISDSPDSPTSPDQSKNDITATLEMDEKDNIKNTFEDNLNSNNLESKTIDETPKRKFSLSMGTFKNSNITPLVPDIRNSKDGIDIKQNLDNDPVPVPSPTQSTKTKINFLQF